VPNLLSPYQPLGKVPETGFGVRFPNGKPVLIQNLNPSPKRKWFRPELTSLPNRRRLNTYPLKGGPFVPFTIGGECPTDTPMQTNLRKIVRQTNQSFASVLLATFWIGLSHPHHTNSTNTKYHLNLPKPSRVPHIDDNWWYIPPQSPQFGDSMGS
jgi:hypothetical protein